MRRATVFLVSFLILVSLATTALAQLSGRPMMTRGEKWEFSIQTRYTGAQEYPREGGSSLSITDDLGVGFGFAYNFNQHFNLGMIFGWRSVPFEATSVLDDGSGDTFNYSGQMDTSTFGATGEYNILKGRFTPYVSGSLAWFVVNTNIVAGWTSGCWWDPWWGYVCGTVPLTYGVSTSTYGLGVGFRYEFSDKVFTRVGYEHDWIGVDSVEGVDVLRIDLGFLF